MRPFLNLKPIEERKQGQGLFVDGVSLSEIIEAHDTPIYVTSLNAVKQRLEKYQEELKTFFKKTTIFYAMKANSSQSILHEVRNANAGVDIVSIGEWRAALKAGISPQNICFAGVGKKEEEWKEALLGGLGFLNVEHIDELESILNYVLENKNNLKTVPILSIRLNPCIDVDTHPHLKTGALSSKFGVIFEHFESWVISKKSQFENIEKYREWLKPIAGIHVHIGSQLMQKEIFHFVVEKILTFSSFLIKNQIYILHIDFGGGLGVKYEGVPADGSDIKEHVSNFCVEFKTSALNYSELMALWGDDFSNLHVCLEPGRSIVASSTIFLTQVLYEKINSSEHCFCYVDAGMNDFPRPSLYDAKHEVQIANFKDHKDTQSVLSGTLKNYQIVGPVCESADFLSKNSLLPQIKKGDTIVFFEAGAYCRSMANNYNLRPIPAEIFVRNSKIENVLKSVLPP